MTRAAVERASLEATWTARHRAATVIDVGTVEEMLAQLTSVVADLVCNAPPQCEDELALRIAYLDHEVRVRVGTSEADDWAIPLSLRMAPLTDAELNVLQYLPTHLTYPEIGEQLCVSRHTVKSQVVSIYRKLGVYSSNAAVETAQELGLVTRYVALPTPAT